MVVRCFLRRAKGEALTFSIWVLGLISWIPGVSAFCREWVKRLIRSSGLFDESYYLSVNADVKDNGVDPLDHYVRWGDGEGRNPMPLFDPSYYRDQVGGIAGRVNSLVHYVWVGSRRKLSPSQWFDTGYYMSRNRDVALSGMEPLRHFIFWGGSEGRNPSPNFDSRFYLEKYPDVAESDLNPLIHFVLYGRKEGRHVRLDDDGGCEYRIEYRAPNVAEILENCIEREGKPVVDVVIPVYKNRDLTLICINSALTAKVDVPHEVVVIDDCGPDETLRSDLEMLSDAGVITLLKNNENKGFVETVNRGMGLHPDRDVVLLNSDAEVYDGWLDRLYRHAYEKDNVASVTPLSNNATICSYPRFLYDNPYPLELGYSELDELCAEVNQGCVVEAPTGVGFCMFVRREALKIVGLFDEKAFGRGYGEENDWCQRAINAGWKNLIAADVFVRHFGSASFQGERQHRVKRAMSIMAKRHPSYDRQVKQFIARDPLKDARARLDLARLRRWTSEQNVLMACHSRGGGAERHLQEDAQKQRDRDRGVFFLRPASGKPTHAVIQHPSCTQLPNMPELELRNVNELLRCLKDLRISCLHSHGLVDFEPMAAEYIRRACDMADIPLHVDIHDYKVICPRINLAKNDGLYCGEPKGSKECNTCLKVEGNEFGVFDIAEWREMHYNVLKDAEKIYVPDRDVSERLRRYFPGLSFRVLPHEEVTYTPRLKERNGDVLRVVVIGALSRIKGYDVLLSCAKYVRKKKIPVKFILMGFSIDDKKLLEEGVEVTGRYDEKDSFSLLRKLGAHVAFFPATVPETYSYTLSKAMLAGLPIVSFDIGAIASRLRAVDEDPKILPLRFCGSPNEIVDFFLGVFGDGCGESVGSGKIKMF